MKKNKPHPPLFAQMSTSRVKGVSMTEDRLKAAREWCHHGHGRYGVRRCDG